MKQIVFTLLSILGVSLILSCQKEPEKIPVSAITLNTTSVTLSEGETTAIEATVSPSTATNKLVLWTTNNSAVATVSNGVVKAIAAGNATITAVADDNGKSATCAVTVNPKIIYVESVSLDETSLELTEGDTCTLKATVKPDNATNKNVTWRSSDESVVTVSDGKVTAIKAGTAKVTVETEDGGKTAECAVTITEKYYAVESVSLNKSSLELTEGESYTLTATVKPDNATNKNVTWRSSNQSVATVSNGKVTALKAGTTTITVKTEDGGITATCTVSVLLTATSIKLSRNSFMGSPGKYYDISVEVTPKNAACDLHWTLFNSSVIANIVNISEDSRTATIKMSSSLYSSYAGIKVVDSKSGLSKSLKIYEMIEDFTWTEPSNKSYGGYPLITIAKGEQHQLQCSYYEYPLENVFESLENFAFYEPTYVVSQPSCINIDSNGIITGVKTGIVGIKPTGRILKKSGGVERVYIKVVDEFEEEEPNNDFPYATEVKEGYPMKFYLSSSSDVDVFKITNPKKGRANDNFEIRVDYSGDGGSSSSARVMRWELYNSNYELFGSGTCNFSGAGGTFKVNKWLNTTTGFLKFHFENYQYPETRPTSSLTLQILE